MDTVTGRASRSESSAQGWAAAGGLRRGSGRPAHELETGAYKPKLNLNEALNRRLSLPVSESGGPAGPRTLERSTRRPAGPSAPARRGEPGVLRVTSLTVAWSEARPGGPCPWRPKGCSRRPAGGPGARTRESSGVMESGPPPHVQGREGPYARIAIPPDAREHPHTAGLGNSV
jgi:hypothetical protein